MSVPVEEVLSLWHELERVRDELPATAGERDLVEEQVAAVRDLYERITEDRQSTIQMLRASQETIDRAFAALAQAHARLGRG